MLEMGLETDGAADCQTARDYPRAVASEILEDDSEVLLLITALDDSSKVG